MGDRIAVAVAREPAFAGPFEPGQLERHLRIVRKRMRIHAGADAESGIRVNCARHAQGIVRRIGAQQQLSAVQIVGGRYLEGCAVSGNGAHPIPGRSENGRVIGEVRVSRIGVRAHQLDARKALRCLHCGERRTINITDHRAFGVDQLDGVDHGKASDDAIARGVHCSCYVFKNVRWGQRACRVVHEHNIHILINCAETESNRIVTHHTAGDDRPGAARIARAR